MKGKIGHIVGVLAALIMHYQSLRPVEGMMLLLLGITLTMRKISH